MLKWHELTQDQKDANAARVEALRAADRVTMASNARAAKAQDFEATALAAADAYRAGDLARAADLIGSLRAVVKSARQAAAV